MTTESAYTSERLQAFLDSVASMSLEHKFHEWYNVEVAAAIDGCKIHGHEVNSDSGSSLLFLNKSAVLCVPKKGHIAHYPRHLIHCFVDDSATMVNMMMGWLCELNYSASLQVKNNWLGKSNADQSVMSLQYNRVYLDGLSGSTKSSVTLTVCLHSRVFEGYDVILHQRS